MAGFFEKEAKYTPNYQGNRDEQAHTHIYTYRQFRAASRTNLHDLVQKDGCKVQNQNLHAVR